jgi:hypothetical protein
LLLLLLLLFISSFPFLYPSYSFSLSSLYGAVALNNTVSLGVFLGLVYFRGLNWDFSAETLATIIVVLAVCLKGAFTTTVRLWHALWVMSLYPISIILVIFLRSKVVEWD